MAPIRIHATSLGCPKARVDTETLLGGLRAVEAVEDPAEADLVFVNTCGFIAPAVSESLTTIIEHAEAAGSGPKRPLVVAAGCLVSRYGEASLASELPEVDLWLPLSSQARWPGLIRARLGLPPAEGSTDRVLSTGPSHAYLKISEGCSHRCAFCTIPSIRGPLASREPAEIEAEARKLLDLGVRELIVVAQDTTAYGRDLPGDVDLRVLLERLLPLAGLSRLRLMYLYPAGLTRELLSFLASAGAPLVPYFDIPLQHAHPDILSRMGRPFARDPRRVVERVRSFFPQAALRTSLITGFPGEGEEHFRTLERFVAEVRFDHLGVFAFQEEEGTPAHAMPDAVEPDVREARRARLMELQASISARRLRELEGERIEVLVDEASGQWPGLHVGRAWFQAPEVDGVVWISGPEVAPGRLVRADVEEAKTYDLVALAPQGHVK